MHMYEDQVVVRNLESYTSTYGFDIKFGMYLDLCGKILKLILFCVRRTVCIYMCLVWRINLFSVNIIFRLRIIFDCCLLYDLIYRSVLFEVLCEDVTYLINV